MTAGLDPLRLTAREARRLLIDGELAASELTKTYLDQIERVEDKVHAFIQVTADNAAKYATEIDQEAGATRGALAGLPTAIKDNMVTEGVTTTCGSKHPGQLPARLHGDRRAAHLGRPHRHAGQGQHGRVRHGLVDRELGLRARPTTPGT